MEWWYRIIHGRVSDTSFLTLARNHHFFSLQVSMNAISMVILVIQVMQRSSLLSTTFSIQRKIHNFSIDSRCRSFQGGTGYVPRILPGGWLDAVSWYVGETHPIRYSPDAFVLKPPTIISFVKFPCLHLTKCGHQSQLGIRNGCVFISSTPSRVKT